ncbi:MAG TPA: T9SS type A sorting domain-containing protein [Puia sp.]|jgi:hypothetical protein|nr:T9SS type A sorting domain-containing protein [Puia sp.]
MKPVYPTRVFSLLVNLIRHRRFAAALLILSGIAYSTRIVAEGTKQVMPSSTNGTGLIVSTTASFPLGNVGSYLGAPVDARVYIYVKDFTTEKVYYGFNWETLSPATPINTYSDVYMNIYNPTGALISTVHLPSTTGSAGFISSYASAVAGPQIGGLPLSGYVPLSFTPTMNGDYYVSFYRSSDGGVTHLAGGESMLSKYFDITVAASAASKFAGRVHCNEWAMSVYNPAKNDIQDPQSPTNAAFFGYTPDSVTVKVSFPNNGFMPLTFIVAFNSFGVTNSGNWLVDRNSINLPNLVSPYLTGGFKVFLNAPDASIYPACSIPPPPVLLAPVISGCPPGPYNVRFMAPQAGDYYMLFDLNGVPGFQNNTADRFIELVNQSPGVITYVWDGKDGLGNVVPANTTFPINFSYRKGRINIPFYDVELNQLGFRVDGVSPAGAVVSNTTLYWNDTQLSSMGTDCSNNNNNTTGTGYNNSVVGVTPVWPQTPAVPTYGRAWSGDGNPLNVTPADSVLVSGTYNNHDAQQCDDYGNARLLNTWAWGIVLNTTQNLTLTCITVSGTVWDDADGSAAGGFTNIRTNSEPGTNAGGGLYANLVDPVTGDVLSSVAVNTDGTYSLANCPVNATGMEIYLTTTQGVIGSPVATAAVPSAWINTSPMIRTFNSTNTDVTGQDFGIEQLPNSVDQTYTIPVPVQNSLMSLNGFSTIASPGPLAGSDPEDGTLGSGKSVVITTVPANEQLYYNGVLVTNNFVITGYNPFLLQMKFTDISVTATSFTYAFWDAANKQDPTPATYSINMSVALAATLSSFTGRATEAGNVLNWTDQSETPDVTFYIQRSVDGLNFTTIGQVAAASGTGSGGGSVNHSFTDNSPTPNTPNEYRLEWTDGRGDVVYSNVVTLVNSLASGLQDVSPNPFRDQVTVRLSLGRTQPVTIRLLDSKGQLLRDRQYAGMKGANSFVLDGLSALPSSVYLVQIVLTDQVFVRKVFNNR